MLLLTTVEKIPTTIVTIELIKLPRTNLDPVSKRLDENSCIIQSLVNGVKELPSKVSAIADSVDKRYSQFSDLVSTVKQELQQFSGSVSSFTSKHELPNLSTHTADVRSSTTAQSWSVA